MANEYFVQFAEMGNLEVLWFPIEKTVFMLKNNKKY